MKSIESFEDMETFLKTRNKNARLRILGYGRIYIYMAFIVLRITKVMTV